MFLIFAFADTGPEQTVLKSVENTMKVAIFFPSKALVAFTSTLQEPRLNLLKTNFGLANTAPRAKELQKPSPADEKDE